jgi:UDP-2,4-diacetamido-2,4,6-trideoxy-beta-L-altropyranose hydrolase
MSVTAPVVTLRTAAPDDCRPVWLWRNDEETRRASFDQAPIDFETHERWFRESLRNPNRKIYIIVSGDRAVGAVRLDLSGERGTVSIHLAPDCRGHGIGPLALRALCDLAFGPLGLVALGASVKADNRPSLSAFAKAGFAVVAGGATVTLEKSRHER